MTISFSNHESVANDTAMVTRPWNESSVESHVSQKKRDMGYPIS